MEIQRDFDLIDIPMEGVAAYWLSLRKLLGTKRTLKPLEEEAQYTREPFVKYLLELLPTNFTEDHVRRYSAAKQNTLLTLLKRKYKLMGMALVDMSSAENPHKTFARMSTLFITPPLEEKQAFHLAQQLVKVAEDKERDQSDFFNVDHKLKDDQLIITLLFFCIWARHKGNLSCRDFARQAQSALFVDGLELLIDSFDQDFIRKRLCAHADTLCSDAAHKMELSLELALALRQRMEYDDMFTVAKAFLP